MQQEQLRWWRLLPLGATACPKDKEPLHWEVFGGMRLRNTTRRGGYYQARCPKCGKDFDVLAPRDVQ